MKDDSASKTQEQPGVLTRKPVPIQALEHDEADQDGAPELSEYFPEHLCDFYDVLKTDYQEIRKINQIIFYETRLIIWLCVVAGILISFRTSLLGGSIVSAASVTVGLINRFIKVKVRPGADLERRLETMRMTALDIERICLRVRMTDAITDRDQKNDVLADLAGSEGFHHPHASSRSATSVRPPPAQTHQPYRRAPDHDIKIP